MILPLFVFPDSNLALTSLSVKLIDFIYLSNILIGMSLSSLNLDAFSEVAKLKSFSQAAKKLHVTQSALSQRVINLEQEIGSSLFIRDPAGVRLTDLGQKLLRYCQSKSRLEAEFMETLKLDDSQSLSGLIRIAGFSTINRSVVLPLFSQFLKEHPGVNLEVRTETISDLPALLFSGATDLILINDPLKKQEVENHLIGHEEYVLIQSTAKSARRELYIDMDEDDTITQDFFNIQSRKTGEFKRNFLSDIYSIIDGVKLGMGRAVVPLHLINDVKGVEVVSGYTSMMVPVHLCYYKQAFFTALQTQAIELIQKGTRQHLY